MSSSLRGASDEVWSGCSRVTRTGPEDRASRGGDEGEEEETKHGTRGTRKEAAVLGIVSRNKRLVGLKRKVYRLGVKLYGPCVRARIFLVSFAFFPFCTPPATLTACPLLSRSAYLSLYKQADFQLKRDTSKRGITRFSRNSKELVGTAEPRK